MSKAIFLFIDYISAAEGVTTCYYKQVSGCFAYVSAALSNKEKGSWENDKWTRRGILVLEKRKKKQTEV